MKPDGTPSDAALMGKVRAGDDEAFRVLIERYGRLVEALIRRALPSHLNRKLSVVDVVQDARLVAYQRRLEYDPQKGSFRNWLLGIARMKAREAARHYGVAAKRAADREVSRGRRLDTAHFVGRGPSPSEGAAQAELSERTRAVRDALPPDYRKVLRLVHEEGLTLGEAAPRLGRSREATKKLYGRALCRFKQLFGGREGGTHG